MPRRRLNPPGARPGSGLGALIGDALLYTGRAYIESAISSEAAGCNCLPCQAARLFGRIRSDVDQLRANPAAAAMRTAHQVAQNVTSNAPSPLHQAQTYAHDVAARVEEMLRTHQRNRPIELRRNPDNTFG